MSNRLVINKDSKNSNAKTPLVDTEQFIRFAKKFLPVFLLAAILPAFLVLASRMPSLSFAPKAIEKHELRLWLEPTEVVVSTSGEVELKVMALFESETKIVPSITVFVGSEESVLVRNPKVTYNIPFNGQVQLGSVTVVPTTAGLHNVAISSNDVKIIGLSDPLEIITKPATLVVKN